MSFGSMAAQESIMPAFKHEDDQREANQDEQGRPNQLSDES
jgi:hypothetical protein